MDIRISNHENIDGYFSGTIEIQSRGELFAAEFGFDIEFRKVKIWNTRAILKNSESGDYKPFDKLEFLYRFDGIVDDEIYNEWIYRYGYSREPYSEDVYLD